jgi:hypothetical protein
MAATPIVANSFQSAANVFNENTPRIPQSRPLCAYAGRGFSIGQRNPSCSVKPEEPLRMRILPNHCGSKELGLRGMHRITQHSNFGDADLDVVAGYQWADTRRCSRGDDVAGM